MSKCDSYHMLGYRGVGIGAELVMIGECWGTRERDQCVCGGDPLKCDFYPEKKLKAVMEDAKAELVAKATDEKPASPTDYKIIAVDFDGTLCENKWPGIGAPRKNVIDYIHAEQDAGAKVILWTCRQGMDLAKAVIWCMKHGLCFDEVNENLPEIAEKFGGDCRKIFAHEYIDDRAVLPDSLEVK